MEIVILCLMTFAIACLFAWLTPLHPLLIAAALALVWAALSALVMFGFASDAALLMGLIGAVFGLWPAGIGAFAGWLLRKRRERIMS